MAYDASGPRGEVLGTPSQEETERVKQVNIRIERARNDRARHEPRIRDCYKFALPWRHKFNQDQQALALDDIFDSNAMTVVEDFAADMLNTFTPMKAAWVEFKPVSTLKPGDARMLKAPIEAYGETLFSEMRRSNLYQALQEAYLDLSVGTMALSIRDINPAEPIHCEALPATELLLDRGLYGRIDGMFRVQKLRGEEVGVMWPEAKRPKADSFIVGDIQAHEVTDGMYRDWSTPATEKWQYVCLCQNRIIFSETYTGRGSSQLVVARWSRDSTTAWGVGPLYRTTPSVKALNYIGEKFLKLFDKHVDPVVSYEDDGVLNLDQGVEGGMWMPRAAGSKAPEVIETKGQLDFAVMTRDDLIHEIKRAHYQDRPEQAGKTPPSATQWADEAAERARRMGTPATNLVIELQYGIIYRFAFLLTKRGVLPKVALQGEMVALEPVSPLLRAQEQEEVVRGDRFVEMINGRFGPQLGGVIVNVPTYADWLREKMGLPEKIVNNEAQIKAAIEQFGQLAAQARAGGVAPNAPAPIP